MIIAYDRNPKYSLYYIGGIILEILNKEGSLPFDTIIQKILDKFKEDLNINYIYLTFDWLYLLSLIDIKNDKVILCK